MDEYDNIMVINKDDREIQDDHEIQDDREIQDDVLTSEKSNSEYPLSYCISNKICPCHIFVDFVNNKDYDSVEKIIKNCVIDYSERFSSIEKDDLYLMSIYFADRIRCNKFTPSDLSKLSCFYAVHIYQKSYSLNNFIPSKISDIYVALIYIHDIFQYSSHTSLVVDVMYFRFSNLIMSNIDTIYNYLPYFLEKYMIIDSLYIDGNTFDLIENYSSYISDECFNDIVNNKLKYISTVSELNDILSICNRTISVSYETCFAESLPSKIIMKEIIDGETRIKIEYPNSYSIVDISTIHLQYILYRYNTYNDINLINYIVNSAIYDTLYTMEKLEFATEILAHIESNHCITIDSIIMMRGIHFNTNDWLLEKLFDDRIVIDKNGLFNLLINSSKYADKYINYIIDKNIIIDLSNSSVIIDNMNYFPLLDTTEIFDIYLNNLHICFGHSSNIIFPTDFGQTIVDVLILKDVKYASSLIKLLDNNNIRYTFDNVSLRRICQSMINIDELSIYKNILSFLRNLESDYNGNIPEIDIVEKAIMYPDNKDFFQITF